MIDKKWMYLSFAILAVLLFTYNLMVGPDYKVPDNRPDFINGLNEKEYTDLADTILAHIDTPFHAEYRVKPNSFLFYYLSNDMIGSPFSMDEKEEKRIFANAKEKGVYLIWKYKTENFIRFQVRISKEDRPQVLVLNKNDTTFKFENGSEVQNAKLTRDKITINNTDENFIFQLSERVYVYFRKPG